jgi:hypothetical protein
MPTVPASQVSSHHRIMVIHQDRMTILHLTAGHDESVAAA